MNELAVEFFYEGIRRIIPGFVILILYWRKELESIFLTHRDFFSPYLFSICIFPVAWLLGFVIDMVTFVPFAPDFYKKLKKCFAKSRYTESSLPTEGTSVQNQKQSNESEESKLEQRRKVYFESASQIMCRCLAWIFLYSFICSCFHSFFSSHFQGFFSPPESFANLSWKSWYWCIGLIAFLLGWLWLKSDESNRNKCL